MSYDKTDDGVTVITDEALPQKTFVLRRSKPSLSEHPMHIRDIRAKRDALIHTARYSLCGCGSGKKAKFCCWDKLVQEARGK